MTSQVPGVVPLPDLLPVLPRMTGPATIQAKREREAPRERVGFSIAVGLNRISTALRSKTRPMPAKIMHLWIGEEKS